MAQREKPRKAGEFRRLRPVAERKLTTLDGMNTLMDILHVLAAVFIIGPMAILPMTALRAIRARNSPQVAALAKSTFVFTLLSLLTVIFGFGVLGTSKYDVSVGTPWIMISLTLYIIAFILNLAVVWPFLRKAARRIAEPRDPQATTSVSDYTMVAMGSGIVSILLLVVVILMVWKP